MSTDKSNTGKTSTGKNTTDTTGKITPEDLESKLREFSSEVDDAGDQAKQYAIFAAVGVGLVVFAVAFMSGRRRGTKKSTVVEIRRI